MTAKDLLEMKLIDGIVPEPPGGAHFDPDAAIDSLRETLRGAFAELEGLSPEEIMEQRYNKFRHMGDFSLEAVI